MVTTRGTLYVEYLTSHHTSTAQGIVLGKATKYDALDTHTLSRALLDFQRRFHNPERPS
jgi:hypothetical protein